MRSPRAAAQTKQVPLPSAPRFDEYGLHHLDCECARCALGFRPTRLERDRQRFVCERAAAAREKAAEAAATATREEERVALATQRLRELGRETSERMAEVYRPVERAATEEELAELKREFGFTRRKDTR